MFRRLRGHMVRCARGRAGRRNPCGANQSRLFYPPVANGKRGETEAANKQLLNRQTVVMSLSELVGGTVGGRHRRPVLVTDHARS